MGNRESGIVEASLSARIDSRKARFPALIDSQIPIPDSRSIP
jgi:hypothetical protein